MSPAPAMPRTTVQKMIGLISILTRAMNPSPSGLSSTAVTGSTYPNTPPARSRAAPRSRDVQAGFSFVVARITHARGQLPWITVAARDRGVRRHSSRLIIGPAMISLNASAKASRVASWSASLTKSCAVIRRHSTVRRRTTFTASGELEGIQFSGSCSRYSRARGTTYPRRAQHRMRSRRKPRAQRPSWNPQTMALHLVGRWRRSL